MHRCRVCDIITIPHFAQETLDDIRNREGRQNGVARGAGYEGELRARAARTVSSAASGLPRREDRRTPRCGLCRWRRPQQSLGAPAP
jgi:hypothetical protein